MGATPTAASPPFFSMASMASRGCTGHFSHLGAPTDSSEMALGLVALISCSRLYYLWIPLFPHVCLLSTCFLVEMEQTLRVCMRFCTPSGFLVPWGIVLHVNACFLTPVHTLVSWGATLCQSDALWGSQPRSKWFRPSLEARWLRAKGLDGPRWPQSSPTCMVLMTCLPRWTLMLKFLAPAFPGKLARFILRTCCRKLLGGCSDSRIHPLLTVVWIGPSGRIDGFWK
jgi:hypothetical protein